MNDKRSSLGITRILCLVSLLVWGCKNDSLRTFLVQDERKWYYIRDSRGLEDSSPSTFLQFKWNGVALSGDDDRVDTLEWTLDDSTLVLTQNLRRGEKYIREYEILRLDSDTLTFVANKYGVTATYALGTE